MRDLGKPGKVEAYSTGFDGSGMQSVFLIVKEGRKHAIVALIGRLGSGLRDAYVRHGASKREVEAVLRAATRWAAWPRWRWITWQPRCASSWPAIRAIRQLAAVRAPGGRRMRGACRAGA